MFCPKCGKMNPDDREKCSGCGAVLHDPEAEAAKNRKKKKSGAVGKIIALAAAAAVAVGGTVFAVSSCDKADARACAEACTVIIY